MFYTLTMKTKVYKTKTELKQIDYITKIVNNVCNELNIPHIEIDFNTNNTCMALSYNDDHVLNIDMTQIICMTQIKNRYNDNNLFEYIDNSKLNSVQKRIKFIICHEIGHYIHFTRYNKSFTRDYKGYSRDLSSKEYRLQNIEHKADKLSLAIMARCKDI